MIKPGHIRFGIDNKVYFEPDGLEKPNWDILSACFVKYGCDTEDIKRLYDQKMKRYEASKQLVEVSNVFWGELSEYWFYDDEVGYEIGYKVIDNQPCKAEIKNNKATIIELIK